MSVYPLFMIFLDDIIASSPTLTLLKFKVINQFLEVAHTKNPNAQHWGFFIDTKNYLIKFIVKTKHHTDRAIR